MDSEVEQLDELALLPIPNGILPSRALGSVYR